MYVLMTNKRISDVCRLALFISNHCDRLSSHLMGGCHSTISHIVFAIFVVVCDKIFAQWNFSSPKHTLATMPKRDMNSVQHRLLPITITCVTNTFFNNHINVVSLFLAHNNFVASCSNGLWETWMQSKCEVRFN